jgi:hypothetical protein
MFVGPRTRFIHSGTILALVFSIPFHTVSFSLIHFWGLPLPGRLFNGEQVFLKIIPIHMARCHVLVDSMYSHKFL